MIVSGSLLINYLRQGRLCERYDILRKKRGVQGGVRERLVDVHNVRMNHTHETCLP